MRLSIIKMCARTCVRAYVREWVYGWVLVKAMARACACMCVLAVIICKERRFILQHVPYRYVLFVLRFL